MSFLSKGILKLFFIHFIIDIGKEQFQLIKWFILVNATFNFISWEFILISLKVIAKVIMIVLWRILLVLIELGIEIIRRLAKTLFFVVWDWLLKTIHLWRHIWLIFVEFIVVRLILVWMIWIRERFLTLLHYLLSIIFVKVVTITLKIVSRQFLISVLKFVSFLIIITIILLTLELTSITISVVLILSLSSFLSRAIL